ncbi:hypothetical protein [Lysobacter sp. Hz 25]|uniref:hypothetical protein n=1 Tax=Lysobacter sp. Hz 25 TaxID=3383698 RepID=UPI0038D4FA6D
MTDCIEDPVGVYPNEPAEPAALTDRYVVELRAWANRVLGIATADRINWRAERRCIRRLKAEGLVR